MSSGDKWVGTYNTSPIEFENLDIPTTEGDITGSGQDEIGGDFVINGYV